MTSKLVLDNLAGRTTAGSITIVGEGNSTTTNLQQGILKCWGNVSGVDTTVNDSFNLSSSADNATGSKIETMTNPMETGANYSVCSTVFYASGSGNGLHAYTEATYTTTQFRIDTLNYNNDSDGDCGAVLFQVAGSLA